MIGVLVSERGVRVVSDSEPEGDEDICAKACPAVALGIKQKDKHLRGEALRSQPLAPNPERSSSPLHLGQSEA